MRYDAFISYSHSADGRLAPAIQGGLQRLARPWYRRRALRVFRDETGLSVNPHLWGSITAAMAESRYFVVLASPDAAASPWVNREIAHWLEAHPPETVLPVLTDGTLEWSDGLGDFDPERSTALPAALWGVFGEEPRYVDLRWARGEEQLDLRHSRFRALVATVAATLHGVERDELEGEDVRQHRRAIRLAWGAGIALVSLTLIAASTAFLAVAYAATARERQHQADVFASRARRNASTARVQQRRAERNANEASQQRTRAEAKTREADANARQAWVNATEADANAETAQRNARQAQTNAARAEQNATRAEQNATRADTTASALALSNQDLQETIGRLLTQTRTAISRQLAAKALIELNRSFDLALLEAVAASRIQDTSEAFNSLLQTLLDQPSIRKVIHPTGSTEQLAISPDGTTIATASLGHLELWDRASGLRLAHRSTTADPSDLRSLVFGPNGVLAESTNGDVTIFAPRTLDARATFATCGSDLGTDLAFAPDGSGIAVGCLDRTGTDTRIELGRIAPTPALVMSVPATGAARSLAFSPDGTKLAWTEDRTATRVIFVQGLVGVQPLVGPLDPADPEGRRADHLVFSSDSRTLESSGGDAVLWDSANGTRLATVRVPPDRAVVAASADQRLLALTDTTTGTGRIEFQDAASGQLVGSAIHERALNTIFAPAWTVAVSADGAHLVADDETGGVMVIDPIPRTPALTTELPIRVANGMAAISQDATTAVVADHATGRVLLHDARSGAAVAELQRNGDAVNAVGVSADGRAAAWSTTDGVVNVWTTAGRVTHRLPAQCPWPQCSVNLRFSPDGRVVAPVPSRPGSPVLWDTATGAAWPTQPGISASEVVGDLAFAPDGRTIALSTARGLLIWDGTRPVRKLDEAGGGLAFSRDGTTLVTHDQEAIKVWSARDWTLRRSIPAPAAYAGVLALSPNGGMLAISQAFVPYSAVRLWDLETGEPLPLEINAQDPPVIGLTFRADGDLFGAEGRAVQSGIGAGAGGVIHWHLGPNRLRREACEIANRDMTAEEWSRAVGGALPYDPPCAAVLARSPAG